jgi:hypothetical protein
MGERDRPCGRRPIDSSSKGLEGCGIRLRPNSIDFSAPLYDKRSPLRPTDFALRSKHAFTFLNVFRLSACYTGCGVGLTVAIAHVL